MRHGTADDSGSFVLKKASKGSADCMKLIELEAPLVMRCQVSGFLLPCRFPCFSLRRQLSEQIGVLTPGRLFFTMAITAKHVFVLSGFIMNILITGKLSTKIPAL